MRRALRLIHLSLFLPLALPAQAQYDAPQARVEVMGLKHWTLAMLRDSVRRYVPGQELHDAACMVTLREQLGFADAVVMHYPGSGAGGKEFLLIKLVEPQERARVRWNAVPVDTFQSLRPDYAPLIVPVTDTSGGIRRNRFTFWLQYGDSARRIAGATESARQRNQPGAVDDAHRLNAFLRSQEDDAARTRAMGVLARDGFWVNRVSASVVLSNFAAHDSTWLALVHALRDPHEAVRSTAAYALSGLTPRAVDWTPAVDDLRALLGGTNVSWIGQVFRVLVRTSVSPELAGALLHENADWVLAHLASEAPMVASDARQLLVRLNAGRDLGPSREAWATWTRSLRRQ